MINNMQICVIGLGRMGKNIALHLLEQGVGVIAYNRSRDDVDEVVVKGAKGTYTLEQIPEAWEKSKPSFDAGQPITAILFVPSGAVVDEVLFGARGTGAQLERDQVRSIVQKGLADIFPAGSIIIDGGNSFYKDSMRRFSQLRGRGMHFLDIGTSGGLEGARTGACLMVGGDEEIYQQVRPVLEKIAVKDGLDYMGPSGAGHFVKMVHNAIEYGMMEAIGEGFEIVRTSQFAVDLAKLARVWSHGSIVSGLLMEKTAQIFAKDPELRMISGEVPLGETEAEMEWLETIGVPHPVIIAARKERVATRTQPSFIGKVIAALRREFGGHQVGRKKPPVPEV